MNAWLTGGALAAALALGPLGSSPGLAAPKPTPTATAVVGASTPATPEIVVTPSATEVDSGAPEPLPSAGAKPRAELRETLLRLPAFAALKEHRPAQFRELLLAVRESPLAAGGDEARLAIARTELVALAPQFLARSADRPVLQYSKLLISQLRQSGPRVGEACYALLRPDPAAAVALARNTSPDLKESMQQELAWAIDSAVKDPRPIPTREQVAPLLDPLVEALQRRFGAQAAVAVHDGLDAPGVDKALACRVTAGLLSSILIDLPDTEAAPLLRYFYSRNARAVASPR